MQVFAPYVILPDSKLPLLDGDVLQPEVAVRELDREQIMFPPINLPIKRRLDDVYLRILLAECSVKQAASLAAQITGLKKNALYDRALQLKEE